MSNSLPAKEVIMSMHKSWLDTLNYIKQYWGKTLDQPQHKTLQTKLIRLFREVYNYPSKNPKHWVRKQQVLNTSIASLLTQVQELPPDQNISKSKAAMIACPFTLNLVQMKILASDLYRKLQVKSKLNLRRESFCKAMIRQFGDEFLKHPQLLKAQEALNTLDAIIEEARSRRWSVQS